MSGAAHDQICRPAKTAGYVPHVMGSRLSVALDGRPRFTWLEAERMRLDPQVQFGLRILRAPLYGVTWKVRADRAAVESWVDRHFTQIYRTLLPKLVRHFEYGVAAGEVTFKAGRAGGKTRVYFDEFHELHPRDAKPLVWERGRRAGKLAGVHVTGGGTGSLYLDRRHGFWFRGESEFGSWWGRPRMAGPYEPWLEKRGRGGAIESRRLWYKKGAFKGPAMRYPIGRTDMGDQGSPFLVSNQDIAREIVEKFEAGGVLALPNVKSAQGDYLWSWEDPKSFSDAAGFLEYPKQLDTEILIGFGIPPELVAAATVGSGYSGRAIPAQVFFSSMDEVAGLIVQAIDEQVMRPLVRWNFGAVNYEITPDSLAKLVASSGPDGKPGDDGAGDKQQGGGKAPDRGAGGGKPKVRLSLRDRERKREGRRERVRLSWTPYEGPKGGKGWVSDSGEVRYQADKPTDDSAAGPESVFAHPDVQKKGFVEGKEPDYAAARARYHEEALGHGVDPEQVHRAAAAQLERQVRAAGGGKPVDRRLEFLTAYQTAADSAISEEYNRRHAHAFAGRYFDEDAAHKRAAAFVDAVVRGERPAGMPEHYSARTLDVDHLDADTRAAVAEDLAHLPAEKFAQFVAHVFDQYGADGAGSEMVRIVRQAAAGVKPAAPAPLKGDAGAIHGDHYLITDEDVAALNGDQQEAFREALRLAPGAAITKSAGGVVVVPVGSPLDGVAASLGLHGDGLDTDEGLRKLFDGIADHPQIPQAAVPASAKNYGTTSGALQPDAAPGDWNPNNVDLYKRLDPKGRWYLLKRAEGNPAAEDDTYLIVPRSELPELSRLPAPYWAGLDTTPGHREELVEQTERREQKASEEGVREKKDIDWYKANIEKHKKRVNAARQEWHKALKGVPADDRPDEPEWGKVDPQELRKKYDARDEHRDALDALAAEYESHADDLESEVEAAKEHAEGYHANNAERVAEVEKYRAAWRSHAEGIAGHVAKVRAANAHAEADDDLHTEVDAALSHPLLELADDASGDAKSALKGVEDALADAGAGLEEPNHTFDADVDPDEYELAEADELPEDGHDSLEDKAAHFGEKADEHEERLKELADAARKHAGAIETRSREWRAHAAEHLQKVRAAVQAALALPADRYTDSDGDGQEVHDNLTELNKQIVAALARLKKKVKLSLTARPDAAARALWESAAGPVLSGDRAPEPEPAPGVGRAGRGATPRDRDPQGAHVADLLRAVGELVARADRPAPPQPAPVVNVPAPVVNITLPPRGAVVKSTTIERDGEGNPTTITTRETEGADGE